MALFESYERRIDKINSVLSSYGIASLEEAEKITKDAGLDVYGMVKGIQPICFENACWAYTVGAAIAIKKGARKASEAAAAIGEGLQAFCIPGSVAENRKVGLGHGNLGKMLLEEDTMLQKIRFPSKLEQIYVDGDDLYVLFESAAYGYRYTSLTQFDRILKLNLNTLLTNSTN